MLIVACDYARNLAPDFYRYGVSPWQKSIYLKLLSSMSQDKKDILQF